MAFIVLPRAGTTVEFLLTCDPSVAAANPRTADGVDPCAVYRITGDEADLTRVPSDSTRVTVRVLREAEIEAAARRAGRCSERGRAIYRRVSVEIVESFAGGSQGRTAAEIVDEMTDDEYRWYSDFEAWLGRRNLAIVEASLVLVSQWPDLGAANGSFPVDALVARLEECSISPRVVLEEIAERALGVSTLGKALTRPSPSRSGGTTTGQAPGRASEGSEAQTAAGLTAEISGESSLESSAVCG